jgi:BirA family biotin operon repressor/biotin-[acetyl-CoA-carboxylase] ligase
LRPPCTPFDGAQVSFVAALAVSDVARALLPRGAHVACKWPNDVLVDGRKIAGILLESAATGTRLDWLVLGVGINVEHHPGVTGAYPSTSLKDVGAVVDADGVLRAYLDALWAWHGRWRADGFAPIRAAWLANALGLHGPVTVLLEPEPLTGRFADLDAGGALVLELDTGERRVIAAGDVMFGAGSQVGRDAARH